MKFVKSLSIALALTAVLGGCAPMPVSTPVSTQAVPTAIQVGQFELVQAPVLSRFNNAVDMLYYDADNRLILRNSSGDEQVLNEPNEKNARRSYNVLHNDGSWRYVVWRPKLIAEAEGIGGAGDKLVYFRASSDGGKTFGPVKRLNAKGGAFKPFVASNGKGSVYVAYSDERNNSVEHDIYLNVSTDHGANWQTEDIKMNGDESKISVNPSVVADASYAHVSWMTRAPDGNFKIFVRTTENHGKTWNPPVAGYVSPKQPVTPMMVKTANGLMLCWGQVDAVRCATSTDHAKSWSDAVTVPDSGGVEGSILAVDPRGRAHLLIAKKTEQQKSKPNLFHAMSPDGANFSTPKRLSGGSVYKSSAILPTLAFGDDDSVMAAWVDYGYYYPVIAANYSTDGGTSWQAEAIVLGGEKGMFNFFPSMVWAGGSYHISWQKAPVRSTPTSLIQQVQYRPGDRGVEMPAPDIARLKARVDTFWTLREQEKWAEIYTMLDPFFRDGNRDDAYIKASGNVKYNSHRFAGEPKVNGLKAMVPVTYDSEVPELVLRGKAVSVPRQEVTIEQEWIWVGGDWYQVFRDIFGGSTVIE